MGYYQKTIKGVGWMGLLRGFTRGLAILKTAVLARILLPSQFGIYGIATIVLGFLETLTETGINIVLIQEKKRIDDYIDSAWVISIIRGIFICVAILLLIPVISTFFNSPESKNILILVSLVPIIRGFINPSCVKYQKNLEFNKQFYYDASLFLVDTIVAISIALSTRSENSLIIGMIAAALLEVFLSFIVFKPQPRFLLNMEKIKQVVSGGKWITGASIFNYLFENIDDIFVGRLLGAAPLGIYQQAYRIASMPASEVGEVFNKVTFPVYVAIGNDKKRIRNAFFKTLVVITFVVIIFGFLVFKFPDQIVNLLLGGAWLSAVPVLQVLAIYGVTKAISNSFFSLFLGLEKQYVVTLVTFIRALTLGVVIYPFISAYGILGAGYSAIVSAVVSLPFFIYFAWKYLK